MTIDDLQSPSLKKHNQSKIVTKPQATPRMWPWVCNFGTNPASTLSGEQAQRDRD